MASERVPVSGSVLRWARTTSGYDIDGGARRLSVSPAMLARWEAEELVPTLVQLRNAAEHYGRPLGLFFLDAPPDEAPLPLADFRTSASREAAWSPALRAEVRRAVAQRDLARELAQLAPDALHLGAGGFPLPTGEAETAGAALRELLGFDEVDPRTWTKPYDALNAAVAAVERRGALVLQTRGVALEEMHGFSLTETPYPVIGLNGSDWPRPKLFTLLHECVHLALEEGGTCDLHQVAGPAGGTDAADVTERLRNRIAASAIMPADRVRALLSTTGRPASALGLDDLGTLGGTFGASSLAFLLRLVDLDLATWAMWRELKPRLDEAYRQARDAAKAKRVESPGGPDYDAVRARDLGHAFAATVLDAFAGRAISSADLVCHLGVRYDQVPQLEQAVRR